MPTFARIRDLLLALAVLPVLALVTLFLLASHWLSYMFRRFCRRSSPGSPVAHTASIIVAGKNGGPVSEKCLRSLLAEIRLDGGSHQIIAIGGQASPPESLLVETDVETRLLPGQGGDLDDQWRLGIAAATKDVIVLLSDDIVVDSRFLPPLLSCFDDPRTFAVAPHTPSLGTEPAAGSGKTRGAIHHGEVHLWQAPWSDDETGPQPILWVPRGCSTYHRERFLQLGGFDPLFIDRQLSDADLCFRAWKRGWHVLLEPHSLVRHESPPGFQSKSPPPDILERDRILFGWKNVTSVRNLLQGQLSLALRLGTDAARGEVNLRPLRFALGHLPEILVHRASVAASTMLSDEEVFRFSSHRYFLSGSRPTSSSEGAVARGSNARPRPTSVPSRQSTAPERPLRILLVCPQLPYPPFHGAAVRMWNLLKILADRCHVDLLSLSEPNADPTEVAASVARLQPFCGTVRTVARRPRSTKQNLMDRSIHIEMFDCPELRETLLDMVDSNQYDIIQFDKTELGQYALSEPAPVQVLVEHVIFHHAYRRQFLKWNRSLPTSLLDYLKLRRYELHVCRRVDGIVTMSPVDAQFLRSPLPSHPCLVDIPNGVDTDYYHYTPNLAEGKDLLFIGNFDHSPNVDAIKYFIRDVFPRIKSSVPEARLLIVGPGPYHALEEVACEPHAVPTGLVEDTRPYLERCAVFVAPILAGSGTRLKVLEAMSAGTPIVSTTVGAEGLEAISGTHLLIADDAPAFADRVITLLQDPELRQRLRSNARDLTEAKYRWQILGERLELVYRQLLARKHRE